MTKLIPVILSGGTGTRLWPLSREAMAKQLVPLIGEETLLQRTLRRVTSDDLFAEPMVIGAESVRFTVKDQVERVAPNTRIVVEPCSRNTLAAILLASEIAATGDPDAVLVVMPSDHLIEQHGLFIAAVKSAAEVAQHEGIAVIGIEPTHPSTAYGYIVPQGGVSDAVSKVARFVEKPDKETAAKLIADGCLWNAGIFCFRAGWLIEKLREINPATVAAVHRSVDKMAVDLGILVPSDAFEAADSISFDHAFMEQTSDASVVRANFQWSDVGDWNALWDASQKDSDGNSTTGPNVLLDSRNNLVRADGRLVCAVGVEDMAIVETPDAILVAPRSRAQDIKSLVGVLKAQNRPEATDHQRNHRPWGWYQTMDLGDRFRVKRIVVTPGAKLSLQKHRHRSEHWVVVSGTAEVTIDTETKVLYENESVYIAIGAVHRLANPGRIPVELIEVQTGGYLEEDDIERIEDEFGRA